MASEWPRLIGKRRKDTGLVATGYSIRLGRLFNAESGRSFITALDHGVTIGVPAGAEDVEKTLGTVIAGGPDAVLVSPGTIEKAGQHFARRNGPSALSAATGSSTIPTSMISARGIG